MKKVLISIFLGLIIIYIGVKIGFIYFYNLGDAYQENRDVIENFEIKEVKNLENVEVDNYLDINGLKIRNDFKDFTKITDGYKLDDNTYFMVRINESMLDYLKNNIVDKKIKAFNDFLEKNDIKNDLDLYNFLYKYGDATSTLFSSFDKIKSNYYVQYIVSIMGNNVKGITEITGEYLGYVLHGEKNNLVVLSLGDKIYYLNFYNKEYFDINYILEILSTIRFQFLKIEWINLQFLRVRL